MGEFETIVEQLRVGGFDKNFSYLLFDRYSGEAALIDPCGDTETLQHAIECHGTRLVPRYILLTHGHHDHTSKVTAAKKFFNAPVAAHPTCNYPHEISLSDRQQLKLGEGYIEVLFSPGHTNDSICYVTSDKAAIFTGDTLFIDCCGYCQPETMFKTMQEVVAPLPGSSVVYSGHDYGSVPFRTLFEEKRLNPYLSARTIHEFKEALKHL